MCIRDRESGVDRHHIFKMAVLRAILHHQNLAVARDNLGLDLAHFLVAQNLDGQLAVDNFGADFRNALRAERIRGAGPAEWRLLLFPRLQQRLFRPFGREGRRCV